MTNLTPLSGALSAQQFEDLKKTPEEVLWRANFNSDETIATYDIALKQFTTQIILRNVYFVYY